jgi:hypothetical protein
MGIHVEAASQWHLGISACWFRLDTKTFIFDCREALSNLDDPGQSTFVLSAQLPHQP